MQHGRAVIVANLSSLELGPSRSVIYDSDIGLRALHHDTASGAEHYLVRYPVGLRTRLHRHSAAHTIVILDGAMEVNGVVLSAGSYCHFPAGEPMRHAPAADQSCLFVIIFDGPVDVTPLDD